MIILIVALSIAIVVVLTALVVVCLNKVLDSDSR